MFSFLRGKIMAKGQGYVILEVHDIGYKVHVNASHYADLTIGQTAELFLHHHVREDTDSLYGFKNMPELEMFEMLLSISGIGPKSALGVIAVASVEDLKDSIARGDSSLLVKVSGIGKKTAERVVLELREKVGVLVLGKGKHINAQSDEIDALMALGYSLSDAREALSRVDSKIKPSGDRIREALKMMR